MNPASTARLRLAFALTLAVLAFPAVAMAQLPDFGSIESTLQGKIKPLVHMIRYLIAGGAVLFGLLDAFKASRGDSSGWMKALLLFLLAGVAAAPTDLMQLFGAKATLIAEVKKWGL